MVRRTPLAVAQDVAERVLKMKTTGEIRGYLTKRVQEIWPNVTLIDMRR
jgi:hypothetical protein